MLNGRARSLVTAAALLAVAGGSVGIAAERATFSRYSLRARATGVSVLYEIKGLLPIDQLVEGASLFSEAQVGPSWSTSLAAAPYPGTTALSAPGTIDGVAGTDLPDYPLAARAEAPVAPHDDQSAGAATIIASAEPGHAIGTAANGAGDAGVRAISEVDAREGLRARGVASSQDLAFADGALTVGTVQSIVAVEVTDGEVLIRENRTIVSEVAVLGTRVVVGNGGVIVADQPIDLSGVAPAAAALEEAGLRVSVVAPEVVRRDHGVSVTSAALVIESLGDVQGRPSTFRVVHGGVRIDVDATLATGATLPVRLPARSAAPSDPGGGARPVAPALGVVPGARSLDRRQAAAAPLMTLAPATAIADPIDFRPLYPWLVAFGAAALALQRQLVAGRRRPARSDLRELWRW